MRLAFEPCRAVPGLVGVVSESPALRGRSTLLLSAVPPFPFGCKGFKASPTALQLVKLESIVESGTPRPCDEVEASPAVPLTV